METIDVKFIIIWQNFLNKAAYSNSHMHQKKLEILTNDGNWNIRKRVLNCYIEPVLL